MSTILPETYSLVLVLLSALSRTARLSSLHGRAWFLWWGLGTRVLGFGIWSWVGVS